MLNLCILTDNDNDAQTLKSCLQDFFVEKQIMGKISIFSNEKDLLTVPSSYDIYIMDMDIKEGDICTIGQEMKAIDSGCHLIYTSSDNAQAYRAANIDADYYIEKPFDTKRIREIICRIKEKIKRDYIIIPTSCGSRRVRSSNVNYIDIVKRSLCYHLKDGEIFDGQTLRSSFIKAITPLEQHERFIFLPPSLLINVCEIKILDTDHLQFENGEVLYFPRKQHDKIEKRWKESMGIEV